MQYNELQDEIIGGESSIIEFKKSTGELSEAMESLCGFLNNQGGTVYIGVKDNGKVVGQAIADKTKQEIARHLKEIEPTHNCEIHYVKIPNSDKQVIVIKTDHHSHNKPFVYKGRPFYREETTTSLMSQQMYQKLFTEKHHLVEWDSRPAKEHSINELSQERILSIMKYILDNRKTETKTLTTDKETLFLDALSRLHLLFKNTPTNGAMILFGQSLSPINYGHTLLKLAFFADENKSAFIDSKQEYGNIFDLLEKAERFIYQHTGVASHFEASKLQRTDVPDYPYMAIREALINAFCHRDYSHNQGYVSVEIYPDKLAILSYGAPLTPISSDIADNPPFSIQRNKLIADVLYRAGFIESFGTGIARMVSLCHEANLKTPEFKVKNQIFSVTLYKSSYQIASTPQLEKKSKFSFAIANLSRRQQAILDILNQQGSLSSRQLFEQLKENITDRTLRTELNLLEKLQFILKTGKARAIVWSSVGNGMEESGRIRKNPEESGRIRKN